MKNSAVPIFTLAILCAACSKERYSQLDAYLPAVPCTVQTANPAGHSYAAELLIDINYSGKQCGIIPLSKNNFWVYEDSVFTDGVFQKVQKDTLRFSVTKKSLTDSLVWWQSNIQVGLPDLLYVSDSSCFSTSQRVFTPGIYDARKEFGLITGDSLRYLTSFSDAAALGRTLQGADLIKTPAGSFSDYLYVDKNARNYRRDQLYFEPGLGVLKYTREQAPMGTRVIKLQQVSTLVSFHLE